MKCPNCLQEIPDNASFCPYCGSKTTVSKYNADETINTDDSEAAEIGSGSHWKYTGPINDEFSADLHQEKDDIYILPTPARKPEKTSGKLPIVIIAISCIVIILSLIFIINNKKGNPPVSGSSSSTAANAETTVNSDGKSPEGTAVAPTEEATVTPIPTATMTPPPEETPIPAPTETPVPPPTETPVPPPTETPVPPPTEVPTPIPEAAVPNVITIYGGIQADAADFLFPESSSEYLTTARMNEVMESSDSNRMHYLSQLAINELLARYGFTFTSSSQTAQDARDQFEGKGWYESAQRICPSNKWDVLRANYFNSYERANFDALNQWQKDHGVYY